MMSPSIIDPSLNPQNAEFIAELYSRFLQNPNSVDPSWVEFFSDLQEDGRAVLNELRGASWAPRPGAQTRGNGGGGPVPHPSPCAPAAPMPPAAPVQAGRPSTAEMRAATLDSIRALMLIRSYRVRGHLLARFDPLGLEGNTFHPELEPRSYGFAESDMDRPIFIDFVLGLETATMREILSVVRETYCGSIGVEFMHIQSPEEKAWIQRRIESIHNQTQFTLRGKRAIYERLVEAEGFERTLHIKYPGTKRFGLDGGETLLPALEQILKRGGQLGVREVVLGMPHRGRLNVLGNLMHKPYVAIFSEFQGHASRPEEIQGSGDVKYHLGTSTDRVFDGNAIHLSLCANPSHLEAVNPVAVGKVRAKQTHRGDKERQQVMAVLLHGDAAFAGQGLVAETLGMSELKGYTTGGTIHFIVNNQIGFTTSPTFSRSSPYPSDVAKMIQAPIFHVNGDDPEAVVHVARIATEFRQEFRRDVVIDMFCYRRHGHNEADEPAFTQPRMYKTIGQHATTREIYAQRLLNEKVLSEDEVAQMSKDFSERMESAFEAAENYKPNKADWFEGRWQNLMNMEGEDEFREEETAVSTEMFRQVGFGISEPPKNFALNSKIARQLKNKRKMIETGEGIDWATGEALAFGTLLAEGKPVRLSGQDSGRGTFSQRHAVLIDQDNEERYIPLNHVDKDQAQLEVLDSPLSEASVLGFEYGYSLAEPHSLILWEAQFGDFANGAQVIIDQFISSGESKWLRLCGLVMLLPHGYEGQGPEHSSARPERYLQLCAEYNMQVVNCTTPAQYFHALRRQLHRNFRKPLVVFTPKSLLRHKMAVSKAEDFTEGSRFYRVLSETDKLVADDKVRRLVLCTGKVYYDLLQARREQGIDDVAIIRIEQLYPWAPERICGELRRYPNAEVVWCQEEPANMGAWSHVFPRLIQAQQKLGRNQVLPAYAGRKEAASPATGLFRTHQKEQEALVARALSPEVLAPGAEARTARTKKA